MNFLLYQIGDPSLYVAHSMFVGCAALECLAAIWAVASRGHWFWRSLGVWAAWTLLVPIRLYEPAWLFGTSSLMIMAALTTHGVWQRRRTRAVTAAAENGHCQPFRFALRDLFLLVLLIGLSLPGLVDVFRNYHPANWTGWLVSSTAVAVIALLTYASVVGPRRRLTLLLLLIALPTWATAVRAAGDWTRVWDVFRVRLWFSADVATLSVMGAEFAIALAVLLALARIVGSPMISRQWRLACGSLLALLLAVSGCWLGWFYGQLLERAPRAVKVELTTNHFQRILAIANRIRTINPKELSVAELRLAVPTTTAPQEMESLLDELLPHLAALNAVPYDPEVDATELYVGMAMPRIQGLRSLARTLQAECRAALAADDPDRAADMAFANVRLGDMLGRGGIAMDSMVGGALGGVGYTDLVRLKQNVSIEQRRALISALQRAAAEREDMQAVLTRDADFAERAYGLQSRLERVIARLGFGEMTPAYSMLSEVVNRQAAANCLLQTDLAIRLFQDEHGHLPRNLSDLLPTYLPSIPIDPYSGQPLKYRAASGDFMLYCVGWDGQDDGGKFGNAAEYHNAERAQETGLDFDLDTLIRP